MRGLLKSKPDALGDIGGMMKKFKGLPRAVLLDLNEKFTETTRGASKCVVLPSSSSSQALNPLLTGLLRLLPLPLPRPKITPNMSLKLQSYMCVLSLIVDNYLLDASAMATDMNVATSKCVYFLGLSPPCSPSQARLTVGCAGITPHQGHRPPAGPRLRHRRPLCGRARGARADGDRGSRRQAGCAQGPARLQGGQPRADQEVKGGRISLPDPHAVPTPSRTSCAYARASLLPVVKGIKGGQDMPLLLARCCCCCPPGGGPGGES